MALSGRQEEVRGPRYAPAHHHHVGVKRNDHITDDMAQIAAELFEDLAGFAVRSSPRGDLLHLELVSGACQVVVLDGARGDQVLYRGSAEGMVPDLAAGRNAFTTRDA